MRPADIASVVVVEELDVVPDGSAAVVARRVVRRGKYEGHLWLVDLVGRARPRQLTTGRVRDGSPRVSPDGRIVAFVRSDVDDDDAPNHICTVRIATGSVRTLAGGTTGVGSVGGPVWSPHGTRLAFTAEVDPPRFVVGDRPPVGSKASRSSKLPSPTARHVSRADWRWDDVGHRDRWAHLFVVGIDRAGRATAPPRQVTRGDWGVEHITWHPNGRTVAFTADLADDADLAPFTKIWGVDVDAGERSKRSQPRLLLDAGGFANRPAFSPDGRWLAAVGVLEPWPLDDISPGLLLGPADGSRPPWALGPELDRPFGNWADTDLNGWMVSGRYGPQWIDAITIAGVVTDRGRALPERWVIDRRTGSLVSGPSASERSAGGPWADVTTHAIAVTAGSSVVTTLGTLAGRAMDLMTVDLAASPHERRWRTVSSFGSAWQRRFVQPVMTRVEAPGDGGPIETWIASPPDAAGAPLPTIVDVHGGPLGCWAPAPHNEVTMLVGAGYRVVLPNIRGSAGYGAAWIRPQLGDWGGVDADDVHAALDHVVALGLADPGRLGAMGLSYGGFMVNWLVGTSQRFRAAVSENGVTNQVGCWANSDSGPEYCRASLLGDPFTPEGVERLWRQSPLRHVGTVRTPLLMLQAEADLRCPPQDNEQFFVALRHLRRDVEYVLYPEESHVYASAGRPDRRIDRMERVLAWFAQHLPT
jgi:dipeptidyl aminopeptidase/acylaminoacyl peptidase